ncbi:MAG: phosphotransferase family protein [Caldilineaceae bacterium]|nr:phosphotransferase family protein [Caldilineaceae bacterium]
MTEETAALAQKFLRYLRQELGDPRLTYAEPLSQLQGGYETHTYRFSLAGETVRLPGPLVLRLYPAFFGPHNAVWESTVQRVLAGIGYPVPQVYLTCTDLAVLGGAFFVMAFLPGQPLMSAPPETVPLRLGTAQAALHNIDPTPLVQALREQGIAPDAYRLDRRLARLHNEVAALPWLHDTVAWLFKHRPPEPSALVICHGDFHPFNTLVDGARVTAVLDWPNFLLADPALDVANTLTIITIPAKHLATTTVELQGVDWAQIGQRYLDAYQSVRPLERSHLPYYQVRRCVHALVEGQRGQQIWLQPAVLHDLFATIEEVTGLVIQAPTR